MTPIKIGVAITNRVTSILGGIEKDYTPVCDDLAEGWTLVARDDLARTPERLQLLGKRYAYIALLEDRQLLLIGARERRPWDGSDEDVLRNPRYYERFEQSHENLGGGVLALLQDRWARPTPTAPHAKAPRSSAGKS
jgi:hypothetical protein